MRSFARLLFISLCANAATFADEQTFTAEDIEYFERKVRPILVERCYSCHSSDAKTIHGSLRLDSRKAILEGGDCGPSVVPGKPDESLFVSVLSYDDDIQMPPKGKLPDAEIAELTAWVKRGAPFPPTADEPERADGKIDMEKGRQFWSFQPLKESAAPVPQNKSWSRQPMDHYVLSAMEREGLTPNPKADRRTLIRRVTFDLIGLPPTPEQVEEFIADDSSDAYEKLVDRLLQSPQHGEKWARLWLDMARYTDKTAKWLHKGGQAHLYRDWVVSAFNDDMPYDQFVHRQLATDMMSETGPEDLPALGLIGLSPTYWKELKLPCEIIKVIVADEWEERVDVVSRTFLGLTVACARCHDHKFDPITSEDYYALAGVFASCRQVERPIISEEKYKPVRAAKSEVEKLEAQIKKLKAAKPIPEDKLKDLQAQVEKIKTTTPYYNTPLATAITDETLHVIRAGKTPQDGTKLDYRSGAMNLPMFVRGNPNRPGPVVPRRFLSVLSKEETPFENGSGRLDLAKSITTTAASLAARVIVNRIWMAHFGQGIVATPSNFGRQGEPPSHPELLDNLAARFIAGGWSIKNLHREILLSATWQQSSDLNPDKAAADPGNKWMSHANRRRLDFEAWRDAMLSASGQLDTSIGGAATALDDAKNVRRTLYGTVHRRDMATTLQIHDFPDPTQHSPKRSATTTALQGLYTLNSPMMSRLSVALINRIQEEHTDDNDRINRVYQLLFSRACSDRERQIGIDFLNGAAQEARQEAWKQYAHMLLASNEFSFLD